MSISFSDYDLLDIINEGHDGCPLCRLEEDRIKSFMKGLLYESVNKREFRRDIRFTRICHKHFELFNKATFEDKTLAGLGPAIIFRDMISSQIEEMEKSSFLGFKKKKDDCYFCTHDTTLPERINSTGYKILSTEDGFTALRNSDMIICLEHYEALLKLSEKKKDMNFYKKLKEYQLEKYDEMVGKLKLFIDKHDHNDKRQIAQEEAFAIKTAFKSLKKR